MLKQRILTAVILIPLVVFGLLALSYELISVIFALVAILAAWEWASLVSRSFIAKLIYLLVCAGGIAASWYGLEEPHVRFLMLVASSFWVFTLFALSFYQPAWLGAELLQQFLHYSGYLVIITGWLALTQLHLQKPALLLFFFVLIWLADSAAYFAGKKFGRNKLAEQLSPGKTREGLWGALVATLLLSLFGVYQFDLAPVSSVYFVLLCLLTALISVIGDLYESLLKRNAGVKDSGFLVPGHGGVLDRIDSLLAAAPGFVLGLYWLG